MIYSCESLFSQKYDDGYSILIFNMPMLARSLGPSAKFDFLINQIHY
jgi:hypothetical protein